MTKTTRRAFLSSVVALVICLTMLIGTTFAWFTDTASTAVNTIHSGKLDVALEMLNAAGDWVSAEGLTLDFVAADGRTEILWEPGCTYSLPTLRIVNKGNLALKYSFNLNFANATENENGRTLADVLTMSIGDWVNTSENPGLEDAVLYGNLIPGGSAEVLPISLTWNPTANDNDYQGLTIDGIAITVYATQAVSEYDSINNTYDADATLPDVWDGATEAPAHEEGTTVYHIENAAQFATFFGGEYSIPAGSTVYLDCDVDLGGRTIKGYYNSVFDSNFDGNGHTVSNFTVTTTYADGEHYCGLFPYVYGGHSVKNLTVENASAIAPDGVGMVGIIAGAAYNNATIDNCHVINCTVAGDKKVGGVVGYIGGATVTNCSATDSAVYCAVSEDTASAGIDHQAGEVLGFNDNGTYAESNTFDNVTVIFGATLVSTAEQLATALDNTGNAPSYTRKIVLTADIDGSDWTAIPGGSNYPAVEIYGNGHTIKNLSACLFDSLPARDFVFDSINFTNVNITEGNNAGLGVIVGEAQANGGGSYTITNCHVNGGKIYSSVESDEGKYVGAFIGRIDGPVTVTMTDCSVKNVELNTFKSVGSLIGYAYGGTMNITAENCAIEGNTSIKARENRNGSTATAGKLFGTLYRNVIVTISNCTVDSTVTLSNTNAEPAHEFVGRSLDGSSYTIN